MSGWQAAASRVPIELARLDGRLAFAAPPARRRAVEPETLLKIAASLRIAPGEILQSQWLCDPPFWVAVMLRDADAVLALTPDFAAMEGLEIGVIGPHTAGETQFEVRGFAPGGPAFRWAVPPVLNATTRLVVEMSAAGAGDLRARGYEAASWNSLPTPATRDFHLRDAAPALAA